MKNFVLSLLILLTIATPARAGTCACTGADFESRWKQADAVFAGTVTDIQTVQKFMKKHQADLPIEVTLSVDEAYKGVLGKTFTLDTSLTKYTCTGYPFEKGTQYLVFAYQRQDGGYEPQSLYKYEVGTYDTGGACGGTKEFTRSADDLKELAKVWTPGDKPGLLQRFLSRP